jgi:hypothetical protein
LPAAAELEQDFLGLNVSMGYFQSLMHVV